MDFVIISGLSGAGKSSASRTLEDIGFYCVDNLPVDLIPQFAQLCLATKGRYERVALVTDVRGSLTFDGLFSRARKAGRDEVYLHHHVLRSIHGNAHQTL